LYEQSLLIVVSDHGDAFGRKSLLQHGVSLYQSQIQVPLIIKFPNQSNPAVVTYPVSGVDLFPTVLNVLGYEIPAGVDGVSLQSSDKLAKRFVIAESYPIPSRAILNPRFGGVDRSIIVGLLKYLTSSQGKSELYDLAEDPLEQHDLLAADGSELEQELAAWLERVQTPHGSGTMDRGTRDSLQALGY
jgi:arylsulfatase A-like enzyme